VAKRQFGVSSHLYQRQRLARQHLLEIAAGGFEVVELVAAPGHFDVHNPASIADLQQWLAEARLDLAAVQSEPDAAAMDDALFVARRIAMKVLVVPVGPRREASKVVERLATLAAPLGVAVAIDSRSPSVTPIGSLVHFVEQADTRIGIALDFATAGKGGALIDAIELSAEHLVSVRVPLDATLDWSAVMTTVQKVGYDGPIVMDATAPGGSGKEMLARARRSREQMERWLTSI